MDRVFTGPVALPVPGVTTGGTRAGTAFAAGLLVAAFVGLAPSAARAQTAEDAATACEEAASLIAEEDFDGALDEAKWCVESLEQIRQQRTLTVFPDAVEGFEGGPLDNQSAMGMTIMNRAYVRGEDEIDVALTTGAAGSGLAALAQMGMSLGGAGGRKLRVQKRTVLDMSDAEGEAQFMIQLKSGGMLTIGSSGLAADEVLAFVRAFPIQALDEALMP